MTRWLITVLISLTWLSGLGTSRVLAGEPAGTREERFELEVRPVLAGTCFPCHGGKKTSGGLRVDSRAALLKGGDNGPAIVPGQPEESHLIRALRHEDETLRMPPSKRLGDRTIAAFTEWVAGGADWPDGSSKRASQADFRPNRHWAFQPVRPSAPPEDPTGWSVHPIDRFIAAKHRSAGVSPVVDADPRTLLRRVTFDLIGLPPTPVEIAAFLADDHPDAFARVVERLLASPHYGERWGRHWMDVARYADTAGDNADYPVPEAARYRDYIIAAFNADKPFDRFVREQIAGDILARRGPPEEAAEKIVATGFLALSRRYATGPYELWHLTLEDAIETTGRAFLGLSLRCARCHDHKFDPVSQRDYYALYGILTSTRFPYAGSEEFLTKKFPRSSFVPLVPDEQARARVDAQTRRLKELETEIGSIDPTWKEKGAGSKDKSKTKQPVSGRLAALKSEYERLRRSDIPPDLPCAFAVVDGKTEDAAIQRGGEPDRPGPVVPRGVPGPSFPGGVPSASIPASSSGRLQLADWIARADHPLTARVIANRVWQHHFGRGIVATPSNLGVRGDEPSHPELLDWLAARLVSSGWSIKDLHRQILLSRTYRLSSQADGHDLAIDPGDRWLWRYPRRRLDAESIRDAMLAVSGRLVRVLPPAHPFPPIETWAWTQHSAFKAVYPSESRSVFLMTQRLIKHPYLAIFDGPDPNTSTDARTRSTVPLQALYLMNNPFVQEQAEHVARRLIVASSEGDQRVRLAYELAWGRPPTSAELERSHGYLQTYAGVLRTVGTPSERLELEAWVSLARVLLTASEFFYVE
jgi:hypothetical protein